MVLRIDKDHIPTSQDKILIALFEYGGELSTEEIHGYTGLNRETIKINCKILVKKRSIYDKDKNPKRKYRLVEPAKLPTFLSFRTRNKTLSMQIMKDLFSSSSSTTQQKKQEQFAKNIGMFILYVLVERTSPEGPWTSDRFKAMIENDPRMKNIDLLRDTWLLDTIDHHFLIEQFNKYVNNDNQTYQELLQIFESTFSNSNKILFHERVDKMRKSRKNEKKNKIKSDG